MLVVKDLTAAPIVRNILQMAVPIAAGDIMFLVPALTQVLGVGTSWYASRCSASGAPGRSFAQLLQLWYASVAGVALQAMCSLWLVRREFRQRVPAVPQPASEPSSI
jgi:hypothetical protein